MPAFGPLSSWTENLNMRIHHLSNNIIVNCFNDINIIKAEALRRGIETPAFIVYEFDTERYKESDQFPDLDGIPDIVCNVIMDHVKDVSYQLSLLSSCQVIGI